ncbi:type 11 methyltransferase [Caballeronia sordidicola]|uniref:Type 11 methyltransferase n=1 Tax=Caballeronia sordidicola TaxID=196367 RepID=A0A158I3D6_CABSO|nr:class I SAM-dependent methyltransferase [Caballeronia sordidicola]SAL51122.1 type 11 methyltransferase [Caballeronia sordidicola]
MRACWCGNTDYQPFGPNYGECTVCGTLVYLLEMPPEKLLVHDDESDFYGKNYWLERQKDEFGTADIFSRARTDLTERNLHWLKTLLKYRSPSDGKALELGCSHGSFVALMRMAGFDASGVELSPWVVDFAQKTFGVPISLGPIENLDITPGSLDVVVAMDVLEHLPDPATTMGRCLELLKPDGLLLVQTPQFVGGASYEEFVAGKNRFLEMLIPEEHIYLFTRESVTRMFRGLGAGFIHFEPAIFAHYDMFFVVSRTHLTCRPTDVVSTALESRPVGRMTLALLDLRERELASESDRIARGEQIDELTRLLKEAETDRAARGQQLEILARRLNESEEDRSARGEQLKTLTDLLNKAQEDPTRFAEQIATLHGLLKEAEEDRTARGEHVETLTRMLKEAEEDRNARGEHVETLARMLNESEADRAARGEQLERLTEMLRAYEEDRSTMTAQMSALETALSRSVGDCAAQKAQLDEVRRFFHHRAIHAVVKVAGGEQFRALEKLIENGAEDRIDERN